MQGETEGKTWVLYVSYHCEENEFWIIKRNTGISLSVDFYSKESRKQMMPKQTSKTNNKCNKIINILNTNQ